MKRLISILLTFSALAFFHSCVALDDSTEKEEEEQQQEIPAIVGMWGAISSSFTDASGKTTNYPKLKKGTYYFTYSINADGTFAMLSDTGNSRTGRWTYNKETREYREYEDGVEYYVLSLITLSGDNYMSIFTDYGDSGKSTENYERIE